MSPEHQEAIIGNDKKRLIGSLKRLPEVTLRVCLGDNTQGVLGEVMCAFLWVMIGVIFAFRGKCLEGNLLKSLKRNDYWLVLMAVAIPFILYFVVIIFDKLWDKKEKEKLVLSHIKNLSFDFLQVTVILFAIWEFFECIVRHFQESKSYSAITVIGGLLGVFYLVVYFGLTFQEDKLLNLRKEKSGSSLANKLIILGPLLFFLSAVQNFSCQSGGSRYFCTDSLNQNLLAWNKGLAVFSLLFSLAGIGLAILEKERERSIKEKEELWRLQLDRIEKQLQAPDEWLAGVNSLLKLSDSDPIPVSESLQVDYERLWEKVYRNWDILFLSVISQRLNNGELIDDILDTIEKMLYNFQQKKIKENNKQLSDNKKKKKLWELWKNAIKCYQYECKLEYIWGMWDYYDYSARELCVDMLIRYGVKKNDGFTEDRLRLLRHPRLRKLKMVLEFDIPGLMNELQYKELFSHDNTKEYEDPDPEIKSWLKKRKVKTHPFGPLHAENAGPEMFRFYVLPNDFESLSRPYPTWIGGVHGSGRTALGRYLYNEYNGKKDVFPVFQFIQSAPLGGRGWIDVLLEALAENLLELLSKRPDAFLDLEEEEQRQFVLLSYYYIGTYQIVTDILSRTDKNKLISKKRKKEKKALKYRLRELFRQIDPQQPSYLLLQSLLSIRPADLTETHIILDIQSRLTSLQSHQLLLLSRELEANRVYLKILSDLPDSDLWRQSEMSYVLSWNETALKDMLRKKEVHTLFEAEEDALNEFVDYANGLPQRMVQLGNEVLKYVVKLKLEPDELLTIDQLKQARENLERKQSVL